MYRKVAAILLLGWAGSGSLIYAGGEGTDNSQANGLQRSGSTVELQYSEDASTTMEVIKKEIKRRAGLENRMKENRSLSDGDVPLPEQEIQDPVDYAKEATSALVMVTARLRRSKSVPLPNS